jgi:hypothetical protein
MASTVSADSEVGEAIRAEDDYRANRINKYSLEGTA